MRTLVTNENQELIWMPSLFGYHISAIDNPIDIQTYNNWLLKKLNEPFRNIDTKKLEIALIYNKNNTDEQNIYQGIIRLRGKDVHPEYKYLLGIFYNSSEVRTSFLDGKYTGIWNLELYMDNYKESVVQKVEKKKSVFDDYKFDVHPTGLGDIHELLYGVYGF